MNVRKESFFDCLTILHLKDLLDQVLHIKQSHWDYKIGKKGKQRFIFIAPSKIPKETPKVARY